MKKLVIQIIGLMLISQLTYGRSSFNITTFNIKWFGLGGEISGTRSDEYRIPWIKEFIKKNLPTQHAFVFQEITDFTSLQKMMKDFSMNCFSYSHKRSTHQKIAICLKDSYDFLPPVFDNNTVMEEVANVHKGGLRPAVHGQIINKDTGKEIAYLIGVHLKAGWRESDVRALQVDLIKNQIKKSKTTVPVILMGDFNSFKRNSTDKGKDDIELFDDILSEVSLKRVMHDYPATFNNGPNKHLFDHAYVSEGTEVYDTKVWKTCNGYTPNSKRFENSSFFKRFISDHCPLTIKILR
jgi:hypothetical protein